MRSRTASKFERQPIKNILANEPVFADTRKVGMVSDHTASKENTTMNRQQAT
jgi:hypothetical protein